MAIKSITSSITELKNTKFNRLDVKYFLLNAIFKNLSKQNKFQINTLEDLDSKISSGSYIPEYVDSSKGIPFTRVANVKPFCPDEQKSSLVYISDKNPKKVLLKEGEIIVARTQASIEKLGVSSIIDKSNEGNAISQHVSKINVNSQKISPYYLVAYLNSKFFKFQTALASHGDTRVEMTHSQLKEVKIIIPFKKIEENIGNKSKKVIKLNRESINLIGAAKEILRKNLKLEKTEQEDSKFFSINLSAINKFGIWNAKSHLPKFVNMEKQITKSLTVKKLGKIAKLKRGTEVGSENYKTDLFKKEEDYAFIRTSDVINNEIDMYPDYFVSEYIAEELKNTLQKGDLIFSKDGKIGEIAISSEHDRAIIASGFVRIRLDEKEISPEYLFTVLSLPETGLFPALRRTVIASTIPHLREERIKEINIPIIEKKEMQKITDLIKKAFKFKDEKKKLIKEIRKEIDGYFKI